MATMRLDLNELESQATQEATVSKSGAMAAVRSITGRFERKCMHQIELVEAMADLLEKKRYFEPPQS